MTQGNSKPFLGQVPSPVRDYWANFVSICGSVGLAMAGILLHIEKGEWTWTSPTKYGVVFAVGLIATVIGQSAQALANPGNKTLKVELQKALEALGKHNKSYLEIINDELRIVFEFLAFGDTERISLYKHNGNTLAMIGRYSTNPNYKKKGRGFHNEQGGVVGRAWANTKAFVDDLPASREKDDFDYQRECVLIWGMTQEDVTKLTMKSRTIAAFSINDSHNNRTAVVVFESMNPGAFQEASIVKLMNDGESKRISLLLERVQAITPDPGSASQEGF